MTTDELMETKLGVIVLAAIERQPELEVITPDIAIELKKWAESNGYTAEAVVCGLANWLGMFCTNVEFPPGLQN